MKKSFEIFPKNFEEINGINYFRLADGKIAVENTNKVTISSTTNDKVELITLEHKTKKTRFWMVNNKVIYALASSSYVDVPTGINFVDFYFSTSYPEGIYVKYMSSDKCGILYISETGVNIVISHKEGYREICFENNLFYAELENSDDKYRVIGESGKLLGKFPTKCKKLEKYMLFYDENKVFIQSSEFEIPGGIVSVEIIIKGNITFVKVTTKEGIYYYTKNMEYLFGPINKDLIYDYNDRYSSDANYCFIYEETDNKEIVQVFYIEIVNDKYICKNLSCKNGIDVYYDVFLNDANIKMFATKDNNLYVFRLKKDKEFEALIKDVDADRYTFSEGYYNTINIVGFKQNIPIYWGVYSSRKDCIEEARNMEFVSKGFDQNINICRTDKEIVVIKQDGKIIFYTIGEKCYMKKLYCKNGYGYKDRNVYVVEKGKEEISMFNVNGSDIW